MKRPYRQQQRAEDQARTRQRIVDAAVALHQEQGIAATSMSGIAARAGVGKVTVYRHFPDEAAMVQACSGHYFSQHPLPDPDTWRAIADPLERLRRGLAETYAYHRETEAMIASVLPEMGGHPLMAPYHDHWRRVAQVLAQPWPVPGAPMLKASLALALSFESWRLLTRGQGLSEEQAIELMLRMIPPVQ